MAASKNTEISAAELEIKRRGRRRLIGAITIALLGVVFLPMIFDSEPKRDVQGKQEISIQLPDKDKVQPLPAPVAPATPAVAPTTPPAAPVTAPAATPPQTTPAATAPAPAEKAPAAPIKEKPAPAEKAAPAPTKTKPAAKEVPAPVTGGFAVQVAALKDAEHAKQLVAKLKELKLPVTTDTVAVNGGKVTRIRVGPYADKAKAESVLAEIKLSGIDGGKVIPLKP